MHRKSLFLEKALDGQTSNMKLYQIQQEKEQEIFLNKFMHHKQESQIEEDLLNESDGDFEFQRKFTDQNIIYQASQKVDVRQDKFVKLEKQNKEIDQRNFNQKWFLRQNSIKKTRRKPSQDDQEEGQNDKCHLKKWFNSSSKKVNKNSMPTNQMENQFQANQLDKMQIPQLTKGSSLQSNPFQIKLQNTFDENTNENIERLTIQQRQKSFIPQIYYEQENSGFCSPVSPEANQTAFSANSSESKTASTEKKMQILNVYSPLKLKKSSISDFQNSQSNQATIQTSKSQVITSFVRQSSEESNQKANPEKKYHIQEILINSNDQQNQKLLNITDNCKQDIEREENHQIQNAQYQKEIKQISGSLISLKQNQQPKLKIDFLDQVTRKNLQRHKRTKQALDQKEMLPKNEEIIKVSQETKEKMDSIQTINKNSKEKVQQRLVKMTDKTQNQIQQNGNQISDKVNQKNNLPLIVTNLLPDIQSPRAKKNEQTLKAEDLFVQNTKELSPINQNQHQRSQNLTNENDFKFKLKEVNNQKEKLTLESKDLDLSVQNKNKKRTISEGH